MKRKLAIFPPLDPSQIEPAFVKQMATLHGGMVVSGLCVNVSKTEVIFSYGPRFVGCKWPCTAEHVKIAAQLLA